jgi:phenylacetate-CoA ligase
MRRVRYGERGTPVYTHLERTSQPMIRLVSGDLSVWTDEKNPCGRTYPRLPLGIFGRIDDMFTIRGENVYPSEIDAALNELPHYGGEHRILISRESTMDELLLRVEADAATYQKGDDAISAFRAETERKLQKVLGLRTVVEVVEPGSIARTDFKARRVIDDRKVFADMQAQMERARP